MKIVWSSDMLDDPSGQRHDELKKVIAAAGEARVIITRCDTPEAVRLGESFGIHMFQGRYIDALVEKSKKILPQ
jgi:EAL domain-containing protein (putative c-di-GMP-specific phosphodiesterase class I)